MLELAEYVKKVADDPVVYAECHAWRRCVDVGTHGGTRAVSLKSFPYQLCGAASEGGGRNG